MVSTPTDLDGLEPCNNTSVGLAMLRAVAEGRAELLCSCEPDLLIDGLGCCDQFTAHRLASTGLIRPVVRGTVGQRVRAELTLAGVQALGGVR